MDKAKYYKILGLKPGANQTEIRRAYRKLVMVYHPDKNQSPDAEAKFILIKHAYEVLTGKEAIPIKRVRSKTSRPTPSSASTNKKDHEERIREARQRQKEQAYKEHVENEQYYSFLTSGPKWKTIQVITILGIVLAIALSLDLLLPHHYETASISGYKLRVGAAGVDGKQLNLVQTADRGSFWISNMNQDLYGKSQVIYIESSWIFHNPINIVARGKLKNTSYGIHFGFYSFCFVLIIGFLIPSILMIYKRKTVRFTLLFHFSYYFVGVLILFFLLSGHRWAHFLTLGFL